MPTSESASRMTSQQYAYLSSDQYKFRALNKPFYFEDVEYEVIANIDRKSGYQGTIYQRTDTKEFIVVHRGTEFDRESFRDGAYANGSMIFSGINPQAKDAIAFTQYALELAKNKEIEEKQKITVTVAGHSLGGSLAQVTAHEFNLKGETFNAYGAAGLLHSIPQGGHNVTNHVVVTDVVSAASSHHGQMRFYAAQRDIVTLHKGGYTHEGDGSGISLSRMYNMGAKELGDAHRIVNFIPGNDLIGDSILSRENQVRASENAAMIARFRTDVHQARTAISPWEIFKPVVDPIQNWVAERQQQQQQAQQQAGERQTERARQIDAELAREHGGPVMQLGTGHVIKLDDTPRPGIHRPDQFASSQEPASPSLFNGQDYAALAQAQGRNAPSFGQASDPTRIVDMPAVTVTAPRSQAQESQEQQQWQQARPQQQLLQLQREEQRHTAGIQAATEQQATARTALDNGLLLTDPDHPAHEHYENARQGVVRVYSHQKQELDDHVEPMAASLVVQAQREGLSNINAVTLSADGQHLVASNTRDATAEHREMVQVPAAQAAHQSVADSSRQWAEQRIAQAQEQIQVHTQARTQVQERAQTYTPTLERAPARTPPHEPDRQAEAQMATANIQVQMQQSQHQSQQAVQQVLLQQNAVREREEERLEKSRQDAQPGVLPGRATDDVSTAPEHRWDHRMASSAGQLPSQPERAPVAHADARHEAQTGVEPRTLSSAASQVENRGAYVAAVARGRSADEDAMERQHEPRREAGHRRDPGESAPGVNHAAAVALVSPKDPRHPDHPDHALHQQIVTRTEALCESKGIPLAGDELDRVAASLTAEAKRQRISSADHVLFSERPGTQEIGENLIVVQGALDKPGIRYGAVVAHEAVQTPIAESFNKLEQVNQTQAMQQQQQLTQEQQQEQSRSAHRMTM